MSHHHFHSSINHVNPQIMSILNTYKILYMCWHTTHSFSSPPPHAQDINSPTLLCGSSSSISTKETGKIPSLSHSLPDSHSSLIPCCCNNYITQIQGKFPINVRLKFCGEPYTCQSVTGYAVHMQHRTEHKQHHLHGHHMHTTELTQLETTSLVHQLLSFCLSIIAQSCRVS